VCDGFATAQRYPRNSSHARDSTYGIYLKDGKIIPINEQINRRRDGHYI